MEYKHLAPKKIGLTISGNDVVLKLHYDIKDPVADFKERHINENWLRTEKDTLSNLLGDKEPEINVKINKGLNQKIDNPEETIELCTLDAKIELSGIDEKKIPEYVSAITERLDNLLGLPVPQTVPPKHEELYNEVKNLGFKYVEITDED